MKESLFSDISSAYTDKFLSNAKEIFENPNDLMLHIHTEGILITRGPGKDFRTIIKESIQFGDSALEEGIQRINKILQDTVSVLSNNEKPCGKKTRLTNETVSNIIKQLKKHGRAYTFPVS